MNESERTSTPQAGEKKELRADVPPQWRQGHTPDRPRVSGPATSEAGDTLGATGGSIRVFLFSGLNSAVLIGLAAAGFGWWGVGAGAVLGLCLHLYFRRPFKARAGFDARARAFAHVATIMICLIALLAGLAATAFILRGEPIITQVQVPVLSDILVQARSFVSWVFQSLNVETERFTRQYPWHRVSTAITVEATALLFSLSILGFSYLLSVTIIYPKLSASFSFRSQKSVVYFRRKNQLTIWYAVLVLLFGLSALPCQFMLVLDMRQVLDGVTRKTFLSESPLTYSMTFAMCSMMLAWGKWQFIATSTLKIREWMGLKKT